MPSRFDSRSWSGAVLTGRVASVREYGAFVDLGAGVQGLLHVSEMAWSRVADPSQFLSPGQEITVKVLRVDEGGQKVALGLKQLSDDPWSTVQASYAGGPGARRPRHARRGVRRLRRAGAGDRGPGARLHVRADRASGRLDEVGLGRDDGSFEILSIEPEKKRIGSRSSRRGRPRAAPRRPPRGAIAPGARVTGKVERHENFGVFVFLAPGRTGLMPLSETGLAWGADVTKAFPVGSDVEVVVLEVDASGRRIRVSHKAVEHAAEAEELRDYTARTKVESSGAFGSLADKLRGALDTRRK